ncbi:MAG: MFS transporter [Lachnospiraceae bacterium]|nr:MFS transporter [Lachnospiraceae bacterium]
MAEEKKGLTSLEKKWVLYDVANSAFTLMVSTLIQIYFKDLVTNDASLIAKFGDDVSAQSVAYWNYAGTICTIAVVFLAPIFGTIADRYRKKKELFIATIAIGAGCTLLLGTATAWLYYIILFVVAKIWYQVSLVIYDSMISDVTTDERSDTVSSFGFAFGYIGSVVPFIICLVLYVLAHLGKLPIGESTAMRIAFVITAVWWFCWSLPLIRSYKQLNFETKEEKKSNGFKEFFSSLKDLATTNKKALFFILGFFFYIDGVYTIIDNASIYGASLGLATVGLLVALLVTQFVAFPCAIITGKMAKKWGTDVVVTICILGYTAIAILAAFMTSLVHFWILCVMVGLFQGGIQALSRSYFSKIIPKEKSGQYFSIYDIFGKGASALGGMIFAVVTDVTKDQHIGIAPIVCFFIVGLILFRISCKTPLAEGVGEGAEE